MSTFAEIATWASQGESDLTDGEFAMMLIRELAEALDRFEYNTAVLFTVSEPRSVPLANASAAVREALGVLRADLPPLP